MPNTGAPCVAAGVQLHELKPLRVPQAWGPHLIKGSSRASLHGKAVVFDRKVAYVGSMNLDPRSVVLNTESGLLLHGEALVGQVADFIEQALQPSRSYRLSLGQVDEAGEPALLWHDQRADGEVIRPLRSAYQRGPAWIYQRPFAAAHRG